FTKQQIYELENPFLQFIDNRDKITEKVDIFVHDRISHLNAFIPPVSHYVKGEKVTYTIGNLNLIKNNTLDLIRRHIAELVLVF
ncbi:hypothetical protein, partial [Sulfuracidifex metallicus]|uniref:hypothetical protein n=1 Tax=Sulfuracidifex metallicus TaxID=47303 RepID=UPI002275A0A8